MLKEYQKMIIKTQLDFSEINIISHLVAIGKNIQDDILKALKKKDETQAEFL